jgi:aryl-alcohol dehydrogenase-like predicted oxidoreductase
MDRRKFIQVSAAMVGSTLNSLAENPMPMAILGKSGLNVSRFTLGGYHMAVGGEAVATRIIHRAIDLGVNFFDNAHHYNNGLSEEIYGRAIGGNGLRQKVLLMTKAERRDKDGALKQLEDSLRRMHTDYLDLWQCHQVSEHSEVDQILAPGGALEAFIAAKEEGKVRHIGFTGHRDPSVHERLLNAFDGWETVQHPVNLIDPHYLSFIEGFLPKARQKELGVLAMKSNAMGGISKNNVASIAECLRFAMSQNIDTLVSGVETVEQLEENVAVVKSFQKMSLEEISQTLNRTRKGPIGSQIENYKRSI